MLRTEKAPKSLIDLLEDDPKTLSEYGAILKRRRVFFLLPAFVTALAAVLLALSLPANYRSVATILIEDQEIPERRDYHQLCDSTNRGNQPATVDYKKH
jgi:capsular polysaccharide biosynthesis protein